MTHNKNRFKVLLVATACLMGLYFAYTGEANPSLLPPIMPYQLLGIAP